MGDDDGVHGASFAFGALVATVLVVLVACIVRDVTANSDKVNWKAQYQELVCQSKHLELGKLENINVCLDPATKAVYKIELPSARKDTK